MSPETIDAMIAAGVTAEVLAAAWKADIIAQQRVLTERRSKDAERQRRHRESRDVTVTNAVNCDPAPNERDNLTPTREEKTEAKASSKKRRTIPDDWQPSEFAEGSESRKVVDSWPPGERPAQVEQFIAHHRSKRNTFIDPQDAWSTWVLNTRKWGIGRHERSSNPTGDAVSNVLRRIGTDDRTRQNAGAGRA